MAKCDLCGGDAKLADMTELLSVYQVPGVESVCPPCRKWADAKLSELRGEIAPKLRAAIAERHGGDALPRRSWWQRFHEAMGVIGAATSTRRAPRS